MLVRVSEEQHQELLEMAKATGWGITDIADFAIGTFFREHKPWPQKIVYSDLDAFRDMLRKQGTNLTRWCGRYNIQPSLVYYIFRSIDQGKAPGEYFKDPARSQNILFAKEKIGEIFNL